MKLLAAREARFLLIGGYAVNAFGYVRNTVDLDVWIAPDADNCSRLVAAVREFGFSSVADSVLDEADAMLRMGVAPFELKF